MIALPSLLPEVSSSSDSWIPFAKMQGAGNDFIVIDNRNGKLNWTSTQRARLCDRHRGIGADGILVMESVGSASQLSPASPTDSHTSSSTSLNAHSSLTPLRMRYYNADGCEAEMCGNGARCFAQFAYHLTHETSLTFDTLAGPIQAERLSNGQIQLVMNSPHSYQSLPSVMIDGQTLEVHCINTGVPHAVIFVTDCDFDTLPIQKWGAFIRHHEAFAPAGTNVNFVQRDPIAHPGALRVRTYERGVEQETLACGTGVTACALMEHLLFGTPSPIDIEVKSGDRLQVRFQGLSQRLEPFESSESADLTASVTLLNPIQLVGPAEFSFEGRIQI